MSSIQVVRLLEAAFGRAVPETGPGGRAHLVAGSLLGALGLAALWGLAAGSASVAQAASSGFKAPLVLLMSALTALPAGVLAVKLTGGGMRARDLVAAFASALLGGALVLAALAPIVAIYFHTSARYGIELGIGSVLAALSIGALVLIRNLRARLLPKASTAAAWLPAALLCALFAVALIQFIALASPILSGPTGFDGGIDRLW
ncbi:MAG TPA: hypothetical protein VNO33_16950 [Kofleriaceae bacterium]|nr:hypothetical protein [Kofleriaceae bacterium]